MSSNSSEAALLAQLLAEFGRVEPQTPRTEADPTAEAHLLSWLLRSHITAAMKQEKVSVRELARRLQVSPAAVSRQLSSEGPIYSTTAGALAAALGRRWHVRLEPVAPGASNVRPAPTPPSNSTSGAQILRRSIDAQASWGSAPAKAAAIVAVPI